MSLGYNPDVDSQVEFADFQLIVEEE